MERLYSIRFWKKMTALLCAVAVLTSSFYCWPAEQVMATETATGITSFVLGTDGSGVEWLDEDQWEFEGNSGNTSIYSYVKDSEGQIELKPASSEATFSSSPVTLHVSTQNDGKLEFETSNDSVKANYSYVSEGVYAVTIRWRDTVTGSVNITARTQYTVAFPDDSLDYSIQDTDESSTLLAGTTKTVRYNSPLEFKVKMKEDAAVTPVVKINGVTTSVKQGTTDIYSFTVQRNTTISVSTVAKSYTVTLPTDELTPKRYTVTPTSGESTVPHGGSYSFYVTPATGREAPTVSLAEGSGGNADLTNVSDNLWMLSNVTGDVKMEVTAGGAEQISVIATPGTGYTIRDEQGTNKISATTVDYGKAFSFRVVPGEGYQIDGVYANGKEVTASGNVYTTDELNSAVTITVQASIKKFTIAPPAVSNAYSFAMNGSTTVAYGDSFSFYVTPAEGYEKPVVYVYSGTQALDSDKVTGHNNLYTCSNVTENMKIEVVDGSKIKYQVTFASGEGYSFDSINQIVEHGANVTFKVTEENGYEIQQVLANNKVLTAVSDTYSLTVTGDTNITVTTKKKSYTVTFSPDSSLDTYTLTKGSTTVEHGSSYTFYAAANEGYEEPKITYTMGDATEPIEMTSTGNGQYVIPVVSGNVTVTITPGIKKQQNIILNSGEGFAFTAANGTDITAPVSVEYGGSYSFKIKLYDAYDKSNQTVTVNNVNCSADAYGVYTISNIKADQIVSVTGVTKNTYTVTLKQGTGYTLTAIDTPKVTAGEAFRFTLTPQAGYDASEATILVNSKSSTPVTKAGDTYSVTVNTDVIQDNGITISVEEETVVPCKYTVTFAGTEAAFTTEQSGTTAYNDIPYNGTYQFTVKAKDFYRITSVVRDGVALTPVGGVYTVSSITENTTVHVDTRAIVKTELMKLLTTGSVSKGTEDGTEDYVVTFATLMQLVEVLTEDEKKNITITGYGTLYANAPFDTGNTDIQAYVKCRSNRKENTLLRQVMITIGSVTMRNYYVKCNLSTDEFGTDAFGIAVKTEDPNKANNRYGAGWIELTIGTGENKDTVTIYSTAVKSSAMAS